MKISILIILTTLLLTACGTPKVNLFPDHSAPLQEHVIEGTAKGKVLVIPIEGTISDSPRRGMLRSEPSMVQEVVAQLRRAEKDKEIKAVLLTINSPGGSVTASDILYHEISRLKEKTGATVVAAMMDIAASGGYYVALSAERIVAHPTTVTGSVGALFIRPHVTGLLEKVGVEVDISKSGANKDMGSPLRPGTKEENEMFDALINDMGNRFRMLVKKERNLSDEQLGTVATARVFTADEARTLGLVDEIGYLSDAVAGAKKLAKLPDDAKVVAYRRTEYADDNIYNTALNRAALPKASLVDLGLLDSIIQVQPGFYYLWTPAVGSN
ncbi:MAG: signal peptide peptidase SppA [Nitrospirota bacterium]|nr:signal peptide peptidase SppA [Nitrospirota bacterium]